MNLKSSHVLIYTESKLQLKFLQGVTGLQFAEQKDDSALGITLLKKFFRETWMGREQNEVWKEHKVLKHCVRDISDETDYFTCACQEN